MKKKLLASVAALSLMLTGCASLLNRDYVHVTPHNTAPTADGDPSILRAESYQELVNALLYFVTTGAETGSIRLYLDSADVEAYLEDACLEVVQEAPLGAYAVDFIKYSVNSVVTYSEADVQITYRRSRDQIASIVSATGITAIRSELESAMASFAPECVLRISYFEGDYEYIQTLIRQAYLAAPETALDYPQASVTFYPENGRQRIVEVLLDYQLEQEELAARKQALAQRTEALTADLWAAVDDQGLLDIRQAILELAAYDPEGGSTAYHALVEHHADSLGLALAMSLLCEELDQHCRIVEGTLDGVPHDWNLVNTASGWRHVDLSAPESEGSPFRVDQEMWDAGYEWDTASTPQSLPAQAAE